MSYITYFTYQPAAGYEQGALGVSFPPQMDMPGGDRREEFHRLPRERIDTCLALHREGRHEEAIAQLETLIEEFPSNALLHNILGALLAETGALTMAIDHFERAVAIKPNFVEAHNNLGLTQFKLGQVGACIESYEAALVISPDFAEAHANLGATLAGMRQWSSAIKCYERALRLEPGMAAVHEGLAAALHELGDAQSALESYNQAAACYSRGGDPVSAVRCYTAVVGPRSDLWHAHHFLGVNLALLGRYEEAADSLREALRLNPNSEAAAFRLRALTGEPETSAPPAVIRDIFDAYAERFDHHLADKLGYDASGLLRLALEGGKLNDRRFARAIDIGCGTGLAGNILRERCDTLIGIDLSERMLAKANARDCYDELHCQDVVQHLRIESLQFDLFVALDVFVYLGALDQVFEAIAASALRSARVIFTTEERSGDGFGLDRSARFSHARDYVAHAADEAGLAIDFYDNTRLRKERGEWVIAGLYVMRMK